MIKIKIYIKLSLKISPLNPGKEILIAKLDQLKFVGFVEKHDGLECYIPSNQWNNKVLDIFYPLEEKGIDIDWCIDFSCVASISGAGNLYRFWAAHYIYTTSPWSWTISVHNL